jgi:hypothetical protein
VVDATNLIVPSGVRMRVNLSAEAHPDTSRKVIEVVVPWMTAVAIPPTTTTDDGIGTGTGGGTGDGSGTGTGDGGGTATGGTP